MARPIASKSTRKGYTPVVDAMSVPKPRASIAQRFSFPSSGDGAGATLGTPSEDVLAPLLGPSFGEVKGARGGACAPPAPQAALMVWVQMRALRLRSASLGGLMLLSGALCARVCLRA